VADRLRRPVVSQVASLAVDEGAVTGKRQTEHGYDVITAPLPAVVAVSDAINEPRYPSLKGIMGAKSKPQEVVSLADLGVEAERAGEPGSRTTVRSSAPPPPKSGQVKLEDDGSTADELMISADGAMYASKRAGKDRVTGVDMPGDGSPASSEPHAARSPR